MDLGIDDKGFLVLGASRGLGRAVAETLHAEGAYVLLGSRAQESVDAVAREIGDRAAAVAVDVASPDVSAVGDAVERELPSLDGILLNSGGPPLGRALELDDAAWQHAFRLLIGGPLALLRALVPRLAHPAGVVWVTSSSVREPIAGLDASNTLRPGVAALVKTLAIELGPGVRVNAVAPGRFDTARVRELDAARGEAAGVEADQMRQDASREIPLRRYGEPAELGRLATFLLSPASSYVTGTSVQVDGGSVTAVP
jgi:3-oxoacyl-[acyl-carrier protein] reductase